MLVSGSLGQIVIEHIHNLPQIDAIFVFCGNKTKHEQWTKTWYKIKGVHTSTAAI
ncbi:unnamed protein product, partial [Rotaria sp. Silwood1]